MKSQSLKLEDRRHLIKLQVEKDSFHEVSEYQLKDRRHITLLQVEGVVFSKYHSLKLEDRGHLTTIQVKEVINLFQVPLLRVEGARYLHVLCLLELEEQVS
ncbi:hypothetical protein V6N13_116071 [Hibiscus sabdariffa]|uniref:Uncharacterized protein n=2 Tax=Hibiscus sabdariffa TaxID=183260 RepID=A0ABR2NCI1_9ROSI